MRAFIDSELSRSILDSVEKGFVEQLHFTQELIKFPSVRGSEQTAQDFLYDALSERGYAMDRWAIDVDEIRHHEGFSPVAVDYGNAINVVATHRPKKERGRSLILNGHVDVVPTGPIDMWKSPPFEPRIDGDWLYGRGSGDMKAGLVANIFAVDALRRIGFQPAARVHLQSVTEEECTGNGALSCLIRGYRADAAIIPEPEDDKLVRANVGVIWFKVHVRGVPVHVREASTGSNAIEACFELIQALRKLESEWNARSAEFEFFGNVEHPINLNVGKISGGDWASTVAAWCSIECRIAIYPGVDPREAAQEIRSCVAEASRRHPFLREQIAEVEFHGFFARGYSLEPGSEAEMVLEHVHRSVYSEGLQSFVTPGYLDGRVFVLYQGTPCLVYGPYSERIHGIDERVKISSVKKITKSIALFIANWCGMEAT